MTVDVTSTSPTDWRYISEGGSSIVFAYIGPSSPHFTGTVIRLRKAAHKDASSSAHHQNEEHEEPDDPAIIFQNRVIERLVSQEFLPRLLSVKVNKQWLQQLRDLSEAHRPEERRAKDGIALERTKAVLADDLVSGEGFVVEIKPKWGFLPSPTHLSPRSKSVKTTTCRFDMHAHVKSTQGEDVALGYCPLDLYSGDEARITKAIHALWDAWIGSSGSVNNMRVFCNGLMLKPSSLPSSLAPLAAQIMSPRHVEPSLIDLRDNFTTTLRSVLVQTPLLQDLSYLQRSLDALDIEGLSALWAEFHAITGVSPTPPLGSGLTEPTLSDWDKFLDVYLNKRLTMDHDHPDVANLQYYCLAYLLSASFKDCSIIIQVHPSGKSSIALIDLDVKPIDRLHKWAILDADIVKAYEKLSQPTICVDQLAE